MINHYSFFNCPGFYPGVLNDYFQITLSYSQITIQMKMQEIMSYKINANCRKFSMILSLMLVCLCGRSQYNFSEVDKLLAPNQQSKDQLVALIYKDGKILYKKEMGEEFTLKSKAPIANSSSWLTAALVMTFVDEGKISLDDKVSTYIPIFETYGKSFITIRQCLSHQTGIADNQKLVAKLLEKRKFESLEDEVNSYAKKEIAANPGTSFFYGDMGLNIAGRVLEVVSKKRFDILAKQRLFTPLNMKNSSFTPEDNAVNPSGGAVSSAGDYLNFLTMILDKGTFMGKRVLSEAAVKEMQTIQTNSKTIKKYVPKGMEGNEYGLGEWIAGTGANTLISCPALNGTFPYIDNCRKYAFILFTKDISGEQAKALQTQIKTAIDRQITGACN